MARFTRRLRLGLKNAARTPKASWIRLLIPAASIAVLALLASLAPDLWRFVPHSTQRSIIVGLLRGLLVAYGCAVAAGTLGSLVAFGWTVRLRRRKRAWQTPARWLLVCLSTLFTLTLAEAGAAALRASVLVPEVRLPERLPDSSDGALRLVVLGGSCAKGYPYGGRLSIGQIVAWRLRDAFPDREIKLEILADGGHNLERQYRKLVELRYRPDVLIIYSGHNEFWTRYPWSRRVHPQRGNPLTWARLHSPLCRLIDTTINNDRVDRPPPPGVRPPWVDWPAFRSEEFAARLASFHRRLSEIVAFCQRQGTIPVLVIPPSNLAGWEPNRSVLPGSSSPGLLRAVSQQINAANSEPDPRHASSIYRDLLARWPHLAEAHFQLARLLLREGRTDEAYEHFVLARDGDGFLDRCPTPFQDVYRSMADASSASSNPAPILIDGPAVFRARSAQGVPSYDLFHDAHHPSFAGHAALAEAVVRALHSRSALGAWPDDFSPSIDLPACAQRFQVDPAGWIAACRWATDTHRFAARERPDPSERLAWADRFEDALDALTAGTPAESLGLPGLGLRVLSNPPFDPPAATKPGGPDTGENSNDEPAHEASAHSSDRSPSDVTP